MITAIRPYTPQNRQRQNFGMLPKGIADNAPSAKQFLTAVKRGKIELSKEDKVELAALEKKTEDAGIKDYFTETLEYLGLKEPKQ